MLKVGLDSQDLNETAKALMGLPGLFARARKSALSSLGYHIRSDLRDYIERGGEGWPALHPLTASFRKKRGLSHRWVKRSRPPRPMAWLGKFARYVTDKEGTAVQIDFGKSRKGRPGKVDPELAAAARRMEEGETIKVTEAMRRFLAATRRKRPKSQVPGLTYFPLRKGTKKIVVPPRPSLEPVWRNDKAKVVPFFERKFFSNVERYMKDGKVPSSEVPW